MADQSYRLIQELLPEGRDAAIHLVNAARAAGWPLVVVEARRGVERQRQLVAAGASKTLQSKHLHGRAFDVAVQGLHPDQTPRALWLALHDLWSLMGGNPPIEWDLVHFEW